MNDDTVIDTTEQSNMIVNSILNTNKNMAVETFSNAIQSDIILGIDKKISNTSPVLYIVANNKEKEEAKSSLLGNSMDIKSVYSLAKQYISPDEKLRGNYTGVEIASLMGKEEGAGWKATKNLSQYCNGTSKHFDEDALLAKEIYNNMKEGKLPKTFAFCLKEFQLNLLSGKYSGMSFSIGVISKFDKKSPLIRSIFKTLPLDKKVLFWQNHTGINSFSKSMNSPFSKKDAHLWESQTVTLTDEVSSKVSTKANAILKHFMGEDKLMVGTKKDDAAKDGVLLSKTNVFMVDSAIRYAEKSIPFKMLKDADKSFDLSLSILKVEAGKKVNSQKYAFLEADFSAFKKNPKGSLNFGDYFSKKGQHERKSEHVWAGRIASKYSLGTLKDAYEKAQKNNKIESDEGYFVSTVHSLGDRKFDYCSLAEDIVDPISIVAEWYSRGDIEPTRKGCLDTFVEHYKSEVDDYVVNEMNLLYCAIMSGKKDTLFHENMRDVSMMTTENISNAIYEEYKNIIISESKKKRDEKTINKEEAYEVGPNTFQHNTYLIVEYDEISRAKALGARWDGKVKLWYTKKGSFVKHFEDFLPEAKELKLASEKALELDTSSFYQAAADLGLVVNGHPSFDGRFKRVDVEGGKQGGKEGAYIGYDGVVASGHVRNFKTGEEKTWSSLDGGDWDNNELSLIRLISKQRGEEQKKITTREHIKNALLLKAEWDSSKRADKKHPYLVKKKVGDYGLRVDSHGSLLMPLCDINGTFSTMQRIGKDGFKMIGYKLSAAEKEGGKEFPTRKEGRFHLIGAKSLSDHSRFVLVEGYATGATIHEALGLPVVVAVDAGNLVSVASQIKNKHKDISLLIAGDNDQKNGSDKNIGIKKAMAAAKVCDGQYVVPTITKEEEKEVSDWNDIASKYGLESVKSQIISKLKENNTEKKSSVENAMREIESENIASIQNLTT